MSLSNEPIIPTNPPPEHTETAAERVRRRRATRRQLVPENAEGQAALLGSLAKRTVPSVEVFIFSLLCGAIMGLGFLLDSQPVLLLGVLLAPLLTPWLGFLFAALTGSLRFLFEMTMALVISIFLVFLGGLITGLASRLFLPITLTNVFIDARLWPAELLVLAVGAVTLVASFVRSENKPLLPNILLAYGFFLPINAAGFGLGSGLEGVWPEGLLVFIVHLALASVLGWVTMFVLKLRPAASGIIVSGGLALVAVVVLLGLMIGVGGPPSAPAPSAFTPTNAAAALPTSTANLAPSATQTAIVLGSPSPNALNFTQTVAVALTQVAQTNNAPSLTPTPIPLTLAITLPATQTPTVTLTLEPVPVYGKINATEGGGANLRQTPNGKYLMTLDNGAIVEIYPDFRQVNGVTWLHVFVTRNGLRIEGWLLESVVLYATPAANFVATPTIGVTPAP